MIIIDRNKDAANTLKGKLEGIPMFESRYPQLNLVFPYFVCT